MSSLIAPVLDYTARDWSRWDTFDLSRYSYVNRQSHGLQKTPLEPPTTYDQTYFLMFRQEYLTNFYGLERQYYLWLQKTPGSVDDYVYNLRKSGDFPIGQIANKVSQELNEHYNTYRIARMKQLRYDAKLKLVSVGPLPTNATVLLDNQAAAAFDKEEIDFRKLPAKAPTIAFLTELLNLHLDKQCMNPDLVVTQGGKDGNGKPWKPYGTWQEKSGVYDQNLHWWIVRDISYLYGHYLHLLDDALIRRIRDSARAALSALWAFQQYTDGYTVELMAEYQNLESQWSLRISGWVGYAYVMKQSEEELRRRGVWGQVVSDKLYEDTTPEAISARAANRAVGQWSLGEITAEAERHVLLFTKRIAKMGLTEFISAYTLYHFDSLAGWLLHAPSQVIYNESLSTWLRLQGDLAANYHAGSASFPSPSLRSYELFSGLDNVHDRYDQYLYLKHVYPQARKPGTVLRVLTSEEKVVANLEINRTSVVLLPPNYRERARSFARNFYAAAQLSGEGILPHKMYESIILSAPSHVVEARFSLVSGQERYNFITPNYTMGHSGESLWNQATTNSLVARISGGRTPIPLPGYVVRGMEGNVSATSYIRLMGETNGTPFARPNGSPAGNNLAHNMRPVVTQYQGFLLATHLFAPTREDSQEVLQSAPWNSNLVLPLGVEMLTAGSTVLPMTVGSRVELAANQLLFTVRHGNSVIVIRLVSADRTASSAVFWQVTPESLACGCGHVVIQHRARNAGNALKSFKVVWLMGSGTFSSHVELETLKQLIQDAPVQQTIDTTGVWDESNQPANDYPVGSTAAPINEVGARRWTVNASIGALNLGVERTDVYLPWNNSPMYSLPYKGPLHAQPYFTRNVARTVQNREILQWQNGEDPYRFLPVQDDKIFAPHRIDGAKTVDFGTAWQTFSPATSASSDPVPTSGGALCERCHKSSVLCCCTAASNPSAVIEAISALVASGGKVTVTIDVQPVDSRVV
jgi:hypothetical protein